MLELGARGNRLRELPDQLPAGLPALRWLSLEDNRLEQLPEQLHLWQRLVHLNVRNNCLRSMPDGLALMPRLRYCFLNSNAIGAVVEADLVDTRQLRKLDLNENPFADEALPYRRYEHVVYGPTVGQQQQRPPTGEADGAPNENDDGDGSVDGSDDEYSINTDSIDDVDDEDDDDDDAADGNGSEDGDEDGGRVDAAGYWADESGDEEDGADELANFLPQLSRFATVFS